MSDELPKLGLEDLAGADHEETTCEGMGPGEPDEVIDDPENVAAADVIRESTFK